MTWNGKRYEDYLGIEDKLHIECINYAHLYPQLLVHHSPMEGKRSRFEQFKLKKLGSKAGFPDFICFDDVVISESISYKGLVCEFKAIYEDGTLGQLSNAQQEWFEKFTKKGYLCVIIYTFDEFKKLMNECYTLKSA